ncbi:ribulose-phosphate 3-epimerase [Campylobacter fetus]|uniref:Ribulose-phosphate 3-epimerase n=3 Tax=Campylobacter fetus TaxID=196 RepID=A0A5L8KZA8_CAMFE|nr:MULTISPECIES: ribulose-phosphate 3-epimerase [Campylobacter]OCS23343.1 ribulose phosphate epimerase [Campylobacter fetus subsp. venerealis cfvi97/532]OCS26367.1 ribulose phosphate epimerase [Campylobacter fetus subsp. venerealis cfvB10]OCS30710.1 ribulose phosphate epimerase [Campylobacter fetus subsp. venerealis LMG 6570 = CCUG 33900]OCS42563.1 ribulose phosphate epimerase [Campylobacter fetus subsp. venerealis cfvi02/298]ABK82608.1 ribulose-phosphate 3-epimerase [Campylobacter fetus subsp
MYVAPSILSADFGKLDDEVKAICEAGADLVHIDVMDGHFVPNLTVGPLVVNAVAKSSSKPLDIHLMVENVPFFVDLFLPLKPKFLSFHIEEEKHPLRLIEYIRKNGVSPAIVLNPHTPVSSLEYIINEVDMVLLMSVNPGFGGQKFIPSVLKKIKELRDLIEKNGAKCMIEVDGGVNGLNVSELDEAGVDIVVAGNFVFSSNDYEQAIKALKL